MLLIFLIFGSMIFISNILSLSKRIKKKKRLDINGKVIPVKLENIYYEKFYRANGQTIHKVRFTMKYNNGSREVIKKIEERDNLDAYNFVSTEGKKKITIDKDNAENFVYGDVRKDNLKAEKTLMLIFIVLLMVLFLFIAYELQKEGLKALF